MPVHTQICAFLTVNIAITAPCTCSCALFKVEKKVWQCCGTAHLPPVRLTLTFDNKQTTGAWDDFGRILGHFSISAS